MNMDNVLDQMAEELRRVLVAKGLDPEDPPGGGPPSRAAFAEYRRRGGTGYPANPNQFALDLVRRVGELHQDPERLVSPTGRLRDWDD